MREKIIQIFVIFFLILLFSNVDFSNSILANSYQIPRIKVKGSTIYSGEQKFYMQAISFNHFMEYPYNNDFHQSLPEILAWLHTEEDYARVKSWGLNTVRLYISPAHIDNPEAFADLKNQVAWARENNLYIIISYFSPPGAVGKDGYYNEDNFWNNIRNSDNSLNYESEYLQNYLANWKKISQEFKSESHALYELLNEPQLLTKWSDFDYDYNHVATDKPATNDEKLYINLASATIKAIRDNQDDNIIIINGLNYAYFHPRYFRFVKELKTIDQNIIYAFHYYEPNDFVWQQCNWPTPSCLVFGKEKKDLIKEDPGWQNLKINFSISDFYRYETKPELIIAASGQPGTYQISAITLKNNNNEVIWQENFINKHVLASPQSDCNTRPINDLGAGLQLNNNKNVEIIDNVLHLSDSANCHNNEIWAGIKTALPQLEANTNYQLSIAVKGDHLSSYGSLKIFFYQPGNYDQPVWTKKIQRYQGPDQEIIKLQLEDDFSQITNNFYELKTNIGDKYQVPIILGEFAVPQRNGLQNDSFEYFKYIDKELKNQNFGGWALHNYREIYHNRQECGEDQNTWCGDYRTYGIYSGWEKSVTEMSHLGLSTDIKHGEYYYRPDLISTIKKTCSQSVVSEKSPGDIKPYQKFLFLKLLIDLSKFDF